jgi:hypothetical protein
MNVPPESQSDGKSSSAFQQTIPILVAKGIRGNKWAINISHSMHESGLSLLQKNWFHNTLFCWCCTDWCMMGQFSIHFMAKEVCRARSLQGVIKALVHVARMMF